MTYKHKNLFTTNLFVPLFVAFFCTTITQSFASAAESEPLVADDAAGQLIFRPRFGKILSPEFNKAAKALYESCISERKTDGTSELEIFKRTYQDLSMLETSIREYIENIHLANDAVHSYINFLTSLESKGEIRLVTPIKSRRSLVLAIVHCLFDFDNTDMGLYQKACSKVYHYVSGASCVSNAIVDAVTGTIIKIGDDSVTTVQNEESCKDHADFGGLRVRTAGFLKELMAIKPVIAFLTATERLKIVGAAAKKAEEHKQ